MRSRISTLAQLMELQRAGGSKFVLMLGAGASLSSGIKPTGTLMQELLDKYGTNIPQDGDLADRFDVLWQRSTDEQRRLFLTPYLNHEPASGYLELARLIQAGYFDLAITFNYDDLLRKALLRIGFNEFHQVIRGETDPAKMTQLVESPPEKFTILKLHGSLYSADTFLFDRSEMLNYPEEIAELFGRLTSRNIIVCGYGFNDNCVTRAFSTEGGSVFWVNPSGAPSNAKGFLLNRKSRDFVISGELGMSDRFFSELSAEILDEDVVPPGESPPRTNPFKFLESFDEEDKDWFFGREALTRKALDKVIQYPGSLHLIGPSKVGKTSLVRAGVLAGLDCASYEKLYWRCRPDLEEQLRELLALRLGRSLTAEELGRGFEELAQSRAKHLVVVLDQFERVVKHHAGTESAIERLAMLLGVLRSAAADRVTFIFTVVNDIDYYKLMWVTAKPESIEVKPLTPDEALDVVQRQASRAGLSFDIDLLEALRGKFQEHLAADGTTTFTLAHLQTICHLLAERAGTGRRSYASLISTELEGSLDSAIRECDVMNFVEDFPAKQERRLLRVIMRIVSESSRRTIAAHIRDRFADLLKDPQYPEPF